jgi:hypothetical protein
MPQSTSSQYQTKRNATPHAPTAISRMLSARDSAASWLGRVTLKYTTELSNNTGTETRRCTLAKAHHGWIRAYVAGGKPDTARNRLGSSSDDQILRLERPFSARSGHEAICSGHPLGRMRNRLLPESMQRVSRRSRLPRNHRRPVCRSSDAYGCRGNGCTPAIAVLPSGVSAIIQRIAPLA